MRRNRHGAIGVRDEDVSWFGVPRGRLSPVTAYVTYPDNVGLGSGAWIYIHQPADKVGFAAASRVGMRVAVRRPA